MSRAFVDPRGCKLRANAVNAFPIWNDPVRPAVDGGDYRLIREKGFRVVRLVMPWSWYEPQPGQWRNIELLDQSIAMARGAGLYVILDPIHLHPTLPLPSWATGSDSVEAVRTHARRWIQFVANRYRSDPTVAAYDLFNEPDPVDQNRVLRMYNEMIGWVREVDPAKIVMTSSPWGNSSMAPQFADAALLTQRTNVVHTFHDYYAGDGNGSTVSNGYNAQGSVTGDFTLDNDFTGYKTTADEPDFAAQLGVQVDFSRRADVPMWIGEFGIAANAGNATAWVDQKIALYERLGLGRAWWMYKCGGALALLTSTCQWEPIAAHLRAAG